MNELFFFIGYDSKEDIAYRVCKYSLQKHSSVKLNIYSLKIEELIAKKLYKNLDLALLTATSFFLMPAVSVSSFLVSTDVVLVLFWSLALLQTLIIKEKPSILNFILLGVFVGLAFLTKYAAIYFIISMIFLFETLFARLTIFLEIFLSIKKFCPRDFLGINNLFFSPIIINFIC